MTVDVKKVWVIDDDQSIRWVIEKALVKNGYEVSCYEEANTPLKDILANKPDVIISDPPVVQTIQAIKRTYLLKSMYTSFDDPIQNK